MALTISKHAKERYAERIMERDSPTDIAIFIRDHEDKIQQDIEKMVEYGTLLYEGPSGRDPKKPVGVTLNGSWVVIWDTKDFVVITLYCIDLGVGSEVNAAFISGALAKIEAARQECATVANRTEQNIAEYQNVIDNAEISIARYKKLIKDLETQVRNCQQMIISANTDNAVANENLRECVEVLIGKQKF